MNVTRSEEGPDALVETSARLPAQGMTASQQADQTGSRVIAALALISLILPFSFSLGSWLLTPSRTLFLILMPIQLAQLLSGRFGRVTYIDVLFLLYMAWRTFVPFLHDPGRALQYAGSNSVIFLGGYLAGRAAIRSVDDFRWMVKLLGGLVIFSFPFAVYETVTGSFVLPKLFEMIPGVTAVTDVDYQRRLGMDRVQFVFVHPIHYGLFCSMALSGYFIALRGAVTGFQRWVGAGLILACCLMSVSSGPFLAALAQLGLVTYAHLLRNVERRWVIFGTVFTIMYVILEIGSNRPAIVAVTSILSFSSSTANVRVILFEYGMQQIYRTPIFGMGFRRLPMPHWMTGSLDNFWLALALVFGVPAFLFLFAAVVSGLIGIGKRKFETGGPLYNARLGWSITLVSATLTLATVYIWSEVASLVMFFIGSGVFLLHAQEKTEGSAPEPANGNGRGGLVYSRFESHESPRKSTKETGPPARPPTKGRA